ncbi:MAG: hypoxanthine phosphoribosyltransferase [Bacteroidales bacterium]|nr:hypoxanthine phosphoribosyltransferase [Bacteroidales bacterium]
MEKVRLLDKNFRLFIGNDEIMKATDRVAEQISRDYGDGKDVPIILCVLNGAIMFTAELIKRLHFDLQLVSTKYTSYSGTVSNGHVVQTMGLTTDIRGRKIIIVEDIIDSGSTIEALKRELAENGAADVKIATMLFKPDAFECDYTIDYIGISIPNKFIVGFGLDYNEIGRNLNDIYVIDED